MYTHYIYSVHLCAYIQSLLICSTRIPWTSISISFHTILISGRYQDHRILASYPYRRQSLPRRTYLNR